jgi:hypothetical protein
MRQKKMEPNRRTFIACCLYAGCAGLADAATPSSHNAKSLKDTADSEKATSGASDGKRSFDIAFCGIYCTACELHLKGNKEGKKCKGCTHPSMESKCVVFACAKEKKVANCGLCEAFEDCEKLKKHHEKPLYRQVARRTCSKIKTEGLDKVIAEQKTRWTCASCGKMFPWNTKGTCPHCGKPVDALSEKDA